MTVVVKCGQWVPSAPRPHFCNNAVKDKCKRCSKEFCAIHIGKHECL